MCCFICGPSDIEFDIVALGEQGLKLMSLLNVMPPVLWDTM